MREPVDGGPEADRPPTVTPVQEQRMLRRARRGDDAAFAAIVEHHDEVIRSLVARLVGTASMDELVLTVYVKAYRALPRTGDSTLLHSWLHRIAYTTSLDRLRRDWRRSGRRKSAARPGTAGEAAGTSTESGAGTPVRGGRSGDGFAGLVPGAAEDGTEANAAAAALASLPVDQRAVLLLIDRHGLLVSDVARTLDVGTSAVRSLLATARDGFTSALPEDARLPGHGGDGEGVGEDSDNDTVRLDDGDSDRQVDGDRDSDSDRLDGLPVPPHGPGFWNELGRRLVIERSAPALPTPTAMTKAARAPETRSRVGEHREGMPAPWLDIAPRATTGGTGIPLGTAGALVLGLVAVLGLAALAVRIGGDADPPLERQGTVAQDVADRLVVRLAGLDSFSATIDRIQVTEDGEARSTHGLVRASDGSYRISGVDGPAEVGDERTVAYHAPSDTRRERQVTATPEGPAVTAREETGFAGGPPDPSPADIALPDADVGLALRSLRSSDQRLAEEDVVGGRAAWVLEAELEEGAPVVADAIVLTVDQATLLPLSVRLTSDGQPVRTTEFRDVVPNGTVAPGSFTVAFAPGDNVIRTDHGFAPIALRDVGNRLGFEALRPTFLPEGFALDASQARAEGSVVSLRYRRGLERVVVSTRSSPVGPGEAWPDPFPSAVEGLPVWSVTLRTGAFARTEMSVAPGADGRLHLWGSDGTVAVTVSGDLTRREIQQVAESLR